MSEIIELPYYGNGGDGYIYGRIFKSSMNQGDWVLDAGEIEYTFSKIEAFNGDCFKLLSEEEMDQGVKLEFYGGFARVNENDSMLQVISCKKAFDWVRFLNKKI